MDELIVNSFLRQELATLSGCEAPRPNYVSKAYVTQIFSMHWASVRISAVGCDGQSDYNPRTDFQILCLARKNAVYIF